MAQLKLTKNELRIQQLKLAQLEKYLPTLKLKKSMLQAEVADAKTVAYQLKSQLGEVSPQVLKVSALFSLSPGLEIEHWLEIQGMQTEHENIAGVEVPVFGSIEFNPVQYSFSQTPIWFESALELLRAYKTLSIQHEIAWKRAQCLEKELQEVSIRVNLFEKVLIPRAVSDIKKIKVFLQDQELAAVARSKVAKSKHRPPMIQASAKEVIL